MKETKEFKTESKRLLDLMINSIYTNQEIFLREVISNASDAIDKYHYLSLIDETITKKDQYAINIALDKNKRTITISDNGIGMTYDELNENLGTIAKSGTLAFVKKLEEKETEDKKENAPDLETIGQFGVGFYSVFMVAKKVVVETKSPNAKKAYRFVSEGSETYTIEELNDERETGTTITLYLKKTTDEDSYDKYLDEYTIKRLIKKYSDYIRYPIMMNVTSSEPKLDEEGKEIEGEYDNVVKLETLNSMIPLWKMNKKDVTDEMLNDFYMNKFMEYEPPLFHLMFNVEGNINYNALLFIPKTAPYNLHSTSYEKGLQLYSKGVFIMDKCKELLPDYLRFVKGVVDSSDLSLNISREMLQQNKVLTQMGTNIEKKIVNRLSGLMNDDFKQYTEFFKQYGLDIKFGIYENYGEKKELLQDLLIYETTNDDDMISLKSYCEKKPEDQKAIYYVSSGSKEEVMAMPQMDIIKKHNYNVIILKDNVDEFVFKILQKYQDVEFKSINQDDLTDLLDEEENKKLEEVKTAKQDLLTSIKEALSDEVKDVIISKRLTDSPVCLTAGDGVSFEMEKVFAEMPNSNQVKADRILEINANHPLFNSLEKIFENNPQDIKDYAILLYNQAVLMEGFKLKDPIAFSNLMCKLMIKSTQDGSKNE